MGLFVMSERELGRLKIIEDVEAHRLSVVQATGFAGARGLLLSDIFPCCEGVVLYWSYF